MKLKKPSYIFRKYPRHRATWRGLLLGLACGVAVIPQAVPRTIHDVAGVSCIKPHFRTAFPGSNNALTQRTRRIERAHQSGFIEETHRTLFKNFA